MSFERCSGCNKFVDTDFNVGYYTDDLEFYCDNCSLGLEECDDGN
jgi:hypothetical protein